MTMLGVRGRGAGGERLQKTKLAEGDGRRKSMPGRGNSLCSSLRTERTW